MVPSVAPCRTCTALDILHAGGLVAVSNSLTKRDFVVGNPSGKATPAFATRLLPDPARQGGTNVRAAIYRRVRKRRTPYTSAFVRGCKPATNMQSRVLSKWYPDTPMKIRKAVFPDAG